MCRNVSAVVTVGTTIETVRIAVISSAHPWEKKRAELCAGVFSCGLPGVRGKA
jgi:hypothetical protein